MLGLLLLSMNNQNLDLANLESLLKTDPIAVARQLRQTFKQEDLAKGTNPVEQGTRALFAVETSPGEHEVSVASMGKPVVKLSKVDGNLYVSVHDFHDGDGYLLDYQVDGKTIRSGIPFEVYEPNPMTQTPPGGMKGELRAMGEWKSKIYPGTIRQWYLYLPPNLDFRKECALFVGQDAQWDRQWMANALENCAREGKIPYTVGVFIEPGQQTAGTYSNRSQEYDPLSPKYSQFLLEEILPEVEKVVKLTKDPAKRAISGMSSGGICSFTACWEHPESFGVAISFIGSFANIASGESKRDGGHNYPFLLRKTDKKPIRVYLQDGENDLSNDHGSWWLCNLQMAAALKYKGYDHVWVPGRGFHSTKHARRVFDQALTWWLGSK